MATRQLTLKFEQDSSNTSADGAGLDALNWGSGIEDQVIFTDISGRVWAFNWIGTLYVREAPVPAPPPTLPVVPPLPNWGVKIVFREAPGGSLECEVSPSVKDQMLTDITGPGSEDIILTFDTLRNYRLRCPTKGIACLYFTPQT